MIASFRIIDDAVQAERELDGRGRAPTTSSRAGRAMEQAKAQGRNQIVTISRTLDYPDSFISRPEMSVSVA